MNRHAMRELVVQTLYQIDVGAKQMAEAIWLMEAFVLDLKTEALASIDDLILDSKEKTADPKTPKLTQAMVENAFVIEEFYFTKLEGIIDRLATIDQLIIDNLEGWSIARLNKVDKAILRLAVYEMLEGVTPIKIVINEAIELTKNFTDTGDHKAASFNNKLLDKIRKKLEVSR